MQTKPRGNKPQNVNVLDSDTDQCEVLTPERIEKDTPQLS